MKTVVKVWPCLVRGAGADAELLVFDHPVQAAGVQIPKGGHEAGEGLEAGALRELLEETGVSSCEVVRHLGRTERVMRGGPHWDGPPERQVHEVFLLRPTIELPDTWEHRADGSEVERGLVFRCRWIRLEDDLSFFIPYFAEVAILVRDSLRAA